MPIAGGGAAKRDIRGLLWACGAVVLTALAGLAFWAVSRSASRGAPNGRAPNALNSQVAPVAERLLAAAQESCEALAAIVVEHWKPMEIDLVPQASRMEFVQAVPGAWGSADAAAAAVADAAIEQRLALLAGYNEQWLHKLKSAYAAHRSLCDAALRPTAPASGLFVDQVRRARAQFQERYVELAPLSKELSDEGWRQIESVRSEMKAAYDAAAAQWKARQVENRRRAEENSRLQLSVAGLAVEAGETTPEPQSSPRARQRPAPRPEEPRPALLVIDWRWQRDGGLIKAFGLVQNSGNVRLDYAKARVRFLDNTGRVVDSQWTYLDNQHLERFEQSMFDLIVQHDADIVRALIDFVDSDDQPILASGAM